MDLSRLEEGHEAGDAIDDECSEDGSEAIDAVTGKRRRPKGGGKGAGTLARWQCDLKEHRTSDCPNMISPPVPGTKF